MYIDTYDTNEHVVCPVLKPQCFKRKQTNNNNNNKKSDRIIIMFIAFVSIFAIINHFHPKLEYLEEKTTKTFFNGLNNRIELRTTSAQSTVMFVI